ncbi:MAG: GMC family oxidoreductase [Steroidobacteraceae bacterium]
MRQFDTRDASVIVVIGSGASGGVISNELAQRGMPVVCLEAGRRLEPGEIVTDEAKMFERITWQDRRLGEGDAVPPFPVWHCKTVGGTTMHWTGTSLRLQPHELKARSTYGDVDGTTIEDWPLRYDELTPWYALAENRMGVTGTGDIGFLPGNNNYRVLEAGARKIGYRQISTNHVAINPAPRDGRPGCQQLGFCTSGCAIGAKWSTYASEIPKAEATDSFELREQCMVTRIVHDDKGRATGVEYLDREGTSIFQAAKAVCVAGNAVETTRLLLNSTSSRFPNGIANSSDQVGRNYMHHVVAAAVGVMPGKVHLHRGTHQAGLVADEAHSDPKRGFLGGVLFETVPFTPEIFARLLMPGVWGERITSVLERYDSLAAMLIHGEDFPAATNRITLHATLKDGYGLPVPVVRYDNHPNSVALRSFALQKARAIYQSLGAIDVFDMIGVFPATHNMGTARMGRNPRTSVCNHWGQTHDIENLYVCDGSLFPTAGCENPTLTIVALALRQAEHLARQFG